MAKKKILVIYYTQTGQLKRIIDMVTTPLQQEADIVFEEIVPVQPFTFPWDKQQFYDTMPETVLGRPRAIQPLKVSPDEHFDLVILAYQPWFLSPSQPTAAFLQSEGAARLLKGKKVLTLIGARNMWLNAQERVKTHLRDIGATLVGNIALVDTSSNLISVMTVLRWQFKGLKEATRYLPPAGVQEKEIQASPRFAAPIARALQQGSWEQLHPQLLELEAVTLKPNLVVLEDRGIRAFRYWSKFISAKGGPGAPERQGRVSMYRGLLLLGIFVLTPITKISAMLTLWLKRQQLMKEVTYFKGIGLR
ncbi:dialkylresorcinol condensing enzyme [Chitinophaga agrisoli]|uniref:Dialkylresorcinol condensing enzyme n=1 Tax=Chitinophaga agrisoli TaxID=2607653 RepID=A0A5B2VNS2_9BACT|nr:dialkylrecorsinol condensing enzyme [Chitinophaga agrisoli]KAA2240434.1 dialkylresorcinol condensing enzyme [Chitinophaga agrisoli]